MLSLTYGELVYNNSLFAANLNLTFHFQKTVRVTWLEKAWSKRRRQKTNKQTNARKLVWCIQKYSRGYGEIIWANIEFANAKPL